MCIASNPALAAALAPASNDGNETTTVENVRYVLYTHNYCNDTNGDVMQKKKKTPTAPGTCTFYAHTKPTAIKPRQMRKRQPNASINCDRSD